MVLMRPWYCVFLPVCFYLDFALWHENNCLFYGACGFLSNYKIHVTLGGRYLKTVDTIGSCQRPVFSLGVSQHIIHKITNLWKFELNRSSKLRENNQRKINPPCTQRCVLWDGWFWDLNFLTWGLEIKFVEKYFFLENYVTLEEAVFHNVLYYQPLPITRYQVRFYGNSYFE